jgi:hypothetical protein
MSFAIQSLPDQIPFITCPYCGDKVYCLESDPGTYVLLLSVNATIPYTLSFTVRGTLDAKYTILWGDNTLTTDSFTGANQVWSHIYTQPGIYNIKFFFDADAFLYFHTGGSSQKFCNNFFNPLIFPNLTYIYTIYNAFIHPLPDFSGHQKLASIGVSANAFTGVIPCLHNLPVLVSLTIGMNNFQPPYPVMYAMPVLVTFNIYMNTGTGAMIDISLLTNLVTFSGYSSSFNGIIPAFGLNFNLKYYYIYSCSLTGNIPSLSNLTVLINFYCYSNTLTGYLASTITLTCVNFRAYNNLLSQAAVDQILFDFYTNLASRPASGYIHLGGTGNSAPSALGLTYKAAIIAKGWSCLTN